MKRILDFQINSVEPLSQIVSLLKLTPADGSEIPPCLSGQFVEVKAPPQAGILLRRPISINFIDKSVNELWLLVRRAGRGTDAICDMNVGDKLNLMMPLGNGFSVPDNMVSHRMLLVGGGVGVAPLLMLGSHLKEMGVEPIFLLGARTAADLLEADLFRKYGDTHFTTDDGSAGTHGVVTDSPVWNDRFARVYCCGPLPMMKAVARKCRDKSIDCEVSLENMMACGLGACLCCVEPTVKGNLCVCTDGPVFNISELLW